MKDGILNTPWNGVVDFKRFHRGGIGRVLVNIYHPWHRIAGCLYGPEEEPSSCGRVAFGRE
jgi:hypothetical protein